MTLSDENELSDTPLTGAIPPAHSKITQFLSSLFHPFLIPTYITSALMLRPGLYSIVLPVELKLWFISVVCGFTFVIPATSVFILLKFRVIESLAMKERNERIIPLLLSSASYMALLFSIKSNNIPPLFLYVLYSATFALLSGLLINLVYRMSMHTLGWSALSAILIIVSIRIGIPLLGMIIASLLISGIVGFVGLKQNTCQQARVYAGYAAGVIVILLVSLFG
jgi:hypothetical protein